MMCIRKTYFMKTMMNLNALTDVDRREGRMHIYKYKAKEMNVGYIKRKLKFIKFNQKMKSAGIISDSLLRIISHLRNGGMNRCGDNLLINP